MNSFFKFKKEIKRKQIFTQANQNSNSEKKIHEKNGLKKIMNKKIYKKKFVNI